MELFFFTFPIFSSDTKSTYTCRLCHLWFECFLWGNFSLPPSSTSHSLQKTPKFEYCRFLSSFWVWSHWWGSRNPWKDTQSKASNSPIFCYSCSFKFLNWSNHLFCWLDLPIVVSLPLWKSKYRNLQYFAAYLLAFKMASSCVEMFPRIILLWKLYVLAWCYRWTIPSRRVSFDSQQDWRRKSTG